MKKALLTALLLFAGCLVTAQNDTLVEAPPPRFECRGYVKYLHNVSFTPDKGSLRTNNFLHNRLNMSYRFSNALSARMELRTRVFWGEQVRQTPGFATLIDYEKGLADLSWTPVKDSALIAHSIVDRLSLRWQHGRWDMVLGRQRVNWGIATTWNPNDLFNAYNFFDFDYEERPGSDALRLRYKVGSGDSGFDLAVSRDKDQKSATAALLYRFNTRGYDFQAIGAWYREDLMLGLGWAGAIGDAGFKGEAAWFQPRNRLLDTTGAFTVVLDASYTFEDGWYVGGAFLYTSLGGNGRGGLENLALQTLSAKQLMPYKYSVLAQTAHSFTPLFTANVNVIYCPGPDALILFPVLTYSLADNWDMDLVAQSFFIPEGKRFKNLGNALVLRVKWGF